VCVAKTLKTAQTESNQSEIVVFCGFGVLAGWGLGALNVVEKGEKSVDFWCWVWMLVSLIFVWREGTFFIFQLI